MYGITKKILIFVKQFKNIFMARQKKVTKPQDSRYMLFLYGDFSDGDDLTNEISMQFVPAVSSEFLKFTYGEFGVVLHFRSKETFEDLKEYVDMVFNDITEQYFLIEVSGDVDIKMPRKLKKDFLNIDGDVKKEEPKTGGIKVDEVRDDRNRDIKNMSFDIFLPMFDPTSPFNKVQEEVLPTVDEILEKITEKGIESLTEKEKEILDNYGKRKNGGH
jgi:hypothetical protein